MRMLESLALRDWRTSTCMIGWQSCPASLGRTPARRGRPEVHNSDATAASIPG